MGHHRRDFIGKSLNLGWATTSIWLPAEVFGGCLAPAGACTSQPAPIPGAKCFFSTPLAGALSLPPAGTNGQRVSAFSSTFAATGAGTAADNLASAVTAIRNSGVFANFVALHQSACSQANDTDTSTTNVHATWAFLLWHRLLLYFFEMALNPPSSALPPIRIPYWDWENNPAVPSLFISNAALSHKRENDPDLSDLAKDRALTCQATSFLLFGGGSCQPGLAAGNPHMLVHDQTGGDMGHLSTAPRDPLFYAHHANIDRMFDSWINAMGRQCPTGICGFADQKIFFTDPRDNQTAYCVQFGDLMDTTKLGYSYDSAMDMPPPAPPADARELEWLKKHRKFSISFLSQDPPAKSETRHYRVNARIPQSPAPHFERHRAVDVGKLTVYGRDPGMKGMTAATIAPHSFDITSIAADFSGVAPEDLTFTVARIGKSGQPAGSGAPLKVWNVRFEASA